jgi:hypothetical protein
VTHDASRVGSHERGKHNPDVARDQQQTEAEHQSIGLLIVRYGLGVVMVVAGMIMLVINPSGLGVDGFAMAVGGGLSVLLINFLFRLGVSGDEERVREEEARRYFDEHGVWPDEVARPRQRQWTIPSGAVTPEQEERGRLEHRRAERRP